MSGLVEEVGWILCNCTRIKGYFSI